MSNTFSKGDIEIHVPLNHLPRLKRIMRGDFNGNLVSDDMVI